jgi:hypothetical protein
MNLDDVLFPLQRNRLIFKYSPKSGQVAAEVPRHIRLEFKAKPNASDPSCVIEPNSARIRGHSHVTTSDLDLSRVHAVTPQKEISTSRMGKAITSEPKPSKHGAEEIEPQTASKISGRVCIEDDQFIESATNVPTRDRRDSIASTRWQLLEAACPAGPPKPRTAPPVLPRPSPALCRLATPRHRIVRSKGAPRSAPRLAQPSEPRGGKAFKLVEELNSQIRASDSLLQVCAAMTKEIAAGSFCYGQGKLSSKQIRMIREIFEAERS